jgi:hypothetical protein
MTTEAVGPFTVSRPKGPLNGAWGLPDLHLGLLEAKRVVTFAIVEHIASICLLDVRHDKVR